MKHLHVALVGGQLEPVYTVIRDTKPDEIVLVCSNRTKSEAEHLSKIVKEDGMTTLIKILKVDTRDIGLMDKSFLKIKEEVYVDSNRVTVNITGGLKPWSIICFRLFAGLENVSLLYRNQDYSLWDFNSNALYPCESNGLTFKDMLRINKILVKTYKNFDDYTKEDDLCLIDIRELRQFNYNAFKVLTEDLYKHKNKVRSEFGLSSLEWDKTSKAFTMILERKGKMKKKVLASPNIRSLLLNTGWFEYEVAALFNKWTCAEYVVTNVRFSINSTDGQQREANETDIVVKTKDKFLFVECKTQVANSTDIDKFNEVGKSFGGLASKRIFITDVEPNANAKDKFQHKKMKYFVMSNISKNDNTIKAFFNELDKYMNSINEK